MKRFLLFIIVFTSIISCENKTSQQYFESGKSKAEKEDYQGALEDFTSAIESEPNKAGAYIIRGLCKLELGDSNGAMDDYNKAISIDPKRSSAYLGRGNVKYELQDYRGSIADYTKALELDSNYIIAYTNRRLSKIKLQDYPGAIQDLTKALLVDIKYYLKEKIVITNGEEEYYKAKIYEDRGEDKEKLNDLEGAILDYSEAIKINGTYDSYYIKRGLARISAGQKNEGCLDLSKAGELGYRKAYDLIKEHCK